MKKILALVSALLVSAALFAAPPAPAQKKGPAAQPAPGKLAPAPVNEEQEIDHFFREFEQYVLRAEGAHRNGDMRQLDELKRQQKKYEENYNQVKRFHAFGPSEQKRYNDLKARLERAFRPEPAPQPKPAPAPAPKPAPAPGKAPAPAPAPGRR